MATMLALLILAAPPAGLENGDFSRDADGDGVPDGWSTSGDTGVTQRLERVRDGDGFAARLTCTAFRASGPASHAMLAQVGKVTLRRGQWYRLRLRLRGEAMAAGAVQVAISDTNGWSNCGLQGGLIVEDAWRERELLFQATREVSQTSRLQFWFGSTGTVWFAEVRLEPVDALRRRYLERVPPGDGNLLPNGGFELGAAGWGSVTDVPGWGGNLNTLYGEVRAGEGRGGGAALRVDLTPERIPNVSFDYFDPFLVRAPFPLAGSRGWIDVTPGRPYTLSAWVRSEPAGVPLILRAYQAGANRAHGNARAGGEWSRVSLTFTPTADQIHAAVGPDLRQYAGGGGFWIDDVALVAGESAGEVAPRAGRGWRLEPVHGLAEVGQPLTVRVWPNADGLRWQVTDMDDQVVAEGTGQPRLEGLPAGSFRLSAAEPMTPPLPLRFAVIQPNRRDDTICGMNHAYPTDDLLALSRRIGLGWFRDWSFQWRLVEPTPGTWSFAGADAQVDRVLREDLRVLALLPFPSALWSSMAEPSPGRGEAETLGVIARAPRDETAFARYVRETVAHLRGRIDAIEVFNEPIYTHYALPRAAGHTVEEYVKLLRLAAAAAREANPDVFVVGGIQAGPETLTAELIAAGGLEPIDALSLHSYPGVQRPEMFLAGLAALRARMAAAGHPDLPLWWTEGAYYADDDPAYEPYASNWLVALPDERLQASYVIRLNAILCAANTRRIIYHSGTPGSLNEDSIAGIFFEYDGQPRKIVPALAAFGALIGPDFALRGQVPAPDGVFGFGFESDGRTVIIAWSLAGAREVPVPAGWRTLDLFGNVLTTPRLALGEQPRYLTGPAGARLPDWR